MTANDKETDSSASATCSNMFSPHVACSGDCSPFQNWKGEQPKTVGEQAVVFQSLVVTLKWQPALDVRMEAKMVRFLGFVTPKSSRLAANFLGSLASHSDDSSTTFIQCIVVLISSASKRIITTTMKMFDSLIIHCSIANRLALVTAGLIPHLISTLNPHSLSLAEAVDIHVYLLNIIWNSLGLATRNSLTRLGIEEDDEQQAVYETVLKYVLVPSEKYIWHLCANRFSIIDGDQSRDFLEILAHLLRISPSYQPTMDFVFDMPVFLTTPSCLTLYENDSPIWRFLSFMIGAQRDWNKKRGEARQMWKNVLRMLRMEGFEDVIEEKLRNDKNGYRGVLIVSHSIRWNNLLGMNLSEQE